MKRFNQLIKASSKVIATGLICGVLSMSSLVANASDYAKGQEYLDQQNWSQAKAIFDEVSKNKGKNQDAALYWKAYAQAKSSEYSEALKTLSSLKKRFPKSNWRDDANALTAEIKDQQGDAAEISDDEMKLYAINSLLSSSSERTVEILAKIIKSETSDRVKKRAIFVLSQSSHEQAYSLITQLASDASNQELQMVAIQTLGMTGSGKALALLKQVYSASDSQEIKHQILKSYMIAGEKNTLFELAKSEKDLELQKHSIHLIGVMNGIDELSQLYKQKSFKGLRADIINAIAIGGGVDELLNIAQNESDQKLVLEAIHKMGIVNQDKAEGKLLDLYTSDASSVTKSAVIQALFIQSNAKALINIVKTEKDNALKRKALKRLSMINSDEVLEFFSQSLQQ